LSAVTELTEPEWVRPIAWWLAYPLGFVGAYPEGAAGPPAPGEHRLGRIQAWLEYLKGQGVNAVALGPIFKSETHGYDPLDHMTLDPRLGEDSDFDAFVAEAHRLGLRVQLDGVFNHVARSHPRVQVAMADGLDSPSMKWFKPLEFGDGEIELDTVAGSDNLIELNHNEPAVQNYVVDVMRYWLDRGIDSWRLDSAFRVPTSFWAEVLPRVRETHPDAYFVAEVINGDYAAFVKASTVDSVTQYELWRAIWSSLDKGNLHQLAWALDRHNALLETFVPTTFIGNQDTSRIASMIRDRRHLPHAVALLAMLGGTPIVYAGDAHGATGFRDAGPDGKRAVRQEFPANPHDLDVDLQSYEVFETYKQFFALRRRNQWLHRAQTETLAVEDKFIVLRVFPHPEDGTGQSLLLLLNLDDEPRERPTDVGPHVFLACDPETARTGVLAPHGWAVAAGEPDTQ